ncbi:MAG: hypothetical protein AT712_00485 [Caldivirga sp. CIS_19]|jgi:hypothetical protein|nr:MAG: hypothetical protein AT712_00485 [Caldivirga sp. CIS_19]
MVGTLRYGVYGGVALFGYVLFLASLRLSNDAAGVLFMVLFSISQLIGLLLISRVGASNTLSIALTIGAVGSYIHALSNSYIGNSLLGLGMGLYFTALIGLMGVILSGSGLVKYIMYIYSGLFGLGVMTGALSSVLNNVAVFVAMTITMLGLSFYISLTPVYFKPRSLKLRYALTNQGVLVAVTLLSFSLPYMISSVILLSKYWLGPLYALSVPLSIVPAYLMVNRWGVRRSFIVSALLMSASSVLTYLFNNQYVILMLAMSSMLIYTLMLQLLGLVTSPLLYMPTLALAYGISSILEIPVGLALGFRLGYLITGLTSLMLILLVRVIKEPVYQIPQAS